MALELRSTPRDDRALFSGMAVPKLLQLTVAVGIAAIIAALTVATVRTCDGHFVYTLDDPLIALAMAWRIAHGDYGINPGEAASPASSILYPFVLAAFAWTKWQLWVPLVVNAAAAVASATVFARIVAGYCGVADRSQVFRATWLIIAVCLAINVAGVVFVGLEHSLHVLTSLLVVLGIARTFDKDSASWWLVSGIVLLPLWRFEGCAMALLAIAALAVTGHRGKAGIALAGVMLTLGGYMMCMHVMHLPLLPSSVLVKSDIADGVVGARFGVSTFLGRLIDNAGRNIQRETYLLLVLLPIVLGRPFWRAIVPGRPGRGAWTLRQEIIFALLIAGTLIAQLVLGRFGALLRYTVYAAAVGTAGALILWRDAIAIYFARRDLVADLLVLACLFYLGTLYVVATVSTPTLARGIYEQQYQMGLIATKYYHGSIAINDLGWVSYRNPNYVLDLDGLGSEEARQARLHTAEDPTWVHRLTQARHTGLAMIYAYKFAGVLPGDWIKVATLHAPHYAAAELDTVTFYATDPGSLPAVLDALRAFDRDKASGIEFQLGGEAMNRSILR